MKWKIEYQVGGPWRIYEEPKAQHTYVISADSASGIPGRNKSAAHVFDVNEHRVVAVFDAVVPPEVLALEIERAGYAYNLALLAPEAYAHGVLVIYKLVIGTNSPYPNVFRHEGQFLSDGGAVASQYGWKPTENNRNLCLSILQADVGLLADSKEERRKDALKIPDLFTIDEMAHFVRNGKGKAEASSGYFDDLVMSLAIGNAVSRQIEKTIPRPEKEKVKTLWDEWSKLKPAASMAENNFYTEALFQPYGEIHAKSR